MLINRGAWQIRINGVSFVIFCNIARCAKRQLPVVGNCAVEFKFHTFTDCPIHRFIGGFAVAAGDRCTGGLSDIILLNTEDG